MKICTIIFYLVFDKIYMLFFVFRLLARNFVNVVFNFLVSLLIVRLIGFFVGHVMHSLLLPIIFFRHSTLSVRMPSKKNSFNAWVQFTMVLLNIVHNIFKNIVDQLMLHRNPICRLLMVTRKFIHRN